VTKPATRGEQKPTPAFAQQPAEPQVTIYLTNGIRTSAGPGPGVKVLPATEAGRLVMAKLAVYGSRSPEAADPEPLARTFGGPIPPTRPAHSN
jgi:hypothetical protein